MTSHQDYIVSTISEDHQTLRQRFQQWGYLYFRDFVAADKCDHLLSSLVNELGPHIALENGNPLPVFKGEPFFETDPIWDNVYPRIQALESFHSFFHDKPIIDLMKLVSDAEVFVYPMKMARISTPRKIGYETPPHQDAHSHNAGPTMAGIWVALHAIDRPTGRLMLLPGSHKLGVRKVFPTPGVGGVQCEIFPDETSWHVSDVKRGDVIIFHSATVHKAEPNTSEDTARLSVDTRFCDHGAPVFSTNLEPHHGWRIEGLHWESIYKNWQSSDFQYYWRDYPNLF